MEKGLKKHDIDLFFESYQENLKRIQKIHNSLLDYHPQAEWVNLYVKKSEQIQAIRKENTNLILTFQTLLESAIKEKCFETIDIIFFTTKKVFRETETIDDYPLLFTITKTIFSFYKKHKPSCFEKYILSFSMYNNLMQDVGMLGAPGYAKQTFKTNAEFLLLQKDYKKLSSECKRIVELAFVNRIIFFAWLHQSHKEYKTIFKYTKDAEIFFEKNILDKKHKNNRLNILYYYTANSMVHAIQKCKKGEQDLYNYYCRKIDYSIFPVTDKKRILRKADFISQKITAKEALCNCMEQYQEYKENSHLYDFDKNFAINYFCYIELHEDICFYINQCDFSNSIKKEKTIAIVSNFIQLVHVQRHTSSNAYIYMKIHETASALFNYAEKASISGSLCRCLLQFHQISTTIHSRAVASIAVEITKELLAQKPALFLHVELENTPVSFSSIKSIENNKNILINFAKKSGYFHDIGKIQLTATINQHDRPFFDIEKKIIASHPEQGLIVLKNVPFLKKYRDVILGHHKYYDGSKGYPSFFNNLSSPYKIFIDITSIADTIDAATDTVGRSYTSQKKNFYSILDEMGFLVQKGRYNPSIIAVLKESKKLQKNLSYITSEGRKKQIYKAYKHFFKDHNASIKEYNLH